MKHATRILIAAALCLVAGAARAQVELKPKVLEGTTRSEHTLSLKQGLKIAGMDVPTMVNVNSATLLTTGKPGADGRRVAELVEGIPLGPADPGSIADTEGVGRPRSRAHPKLAWGRRLASG